MNIEEEAQQPIFKISLLAISLFIMLPGIIGPALPLMEKTFSEIPKVQVELLTTIPNFGDWVKDYAKSEQQSRHYGLKKSFGLKAEGTRYGFASLLALLGFAIYLVEKGHVGSAVTVLLGTLVAIVGLFVIGKKIETQPNKNE